MEYFTIAMENLSRLYPYSQDFATTVLTGLITAFALFFMLIQISYSVNEIPKRILRKYTLRKLPTIIFIVYFGFAICFSTFSFLKRSTYFNSFILGVVFLIAVALLIYYFLWFSHRLHPQGILNEIIKNIAKGFKKVSRFEKKMILNFNGFRRFYKENSKHFQQMDFDVNVKYFSH